MIERLCGNADILDVNLPAAGAAREEEVAGLAPEERHRLVGFDGLAEDRAGRAGDARREIDRDDARACVARGIHPPQELGRLPRDRPGKPCAEEGIDDRRRAVERHRGGIEDRAEKFAARRRSVAAQRLFGAEQRGRDRKPPFGKEPCRNEAVAAIVAGSAQDDDGPLRLPLARPAHNHARHRLPGPLHEAQPAHPGLDRMAIGLRHLGRAQQLQSLGHHRSEALA